MKPKIDHGNMRLSDRSNRPISSTFPLHVGWLPNRKAQAHLAISLKYCCIFNLIEFENNFSSIKQKWVSSVTYAGFFNKGGSVTSHCDDVKFYVIRRHHDVTSLAVSI